MATIPLVALSVRTPNAIQDASAAQQLQGTRQAVQQQAALAPGQLQQQQQQLQLGQQQIQQGQFAVQDREAGMKAMQQWDGKDPNQIPDLIKQNGGSLQAVLGAKKAAIENQQSILNLNTAKLAQLKTQNDYLLGKLQAASDPSVPDSQLAQSLMNAGQDAVKDGYLDPPHAQQLQQFIQQYPDPKDLRTQLGIYEKGLQSQSEQFAQEQENRRTTSAEQEAQAKVTSANTSAAELQAKLPGGALNRVSEDVQIATNPQIQQGKVEVAAAEGAARAQVATQAARGSNAALANVPEHLIPAATTAATKAGDDLAQAQSVSDRLNEMMDAAKRGNVVSYQLLPQEGALQLTTSQGVKRINMAEIQNYGGGSLWQKMEGHFGKALTGKSIPDSVLNDMAEMQKIQAQGAQTKYQNTLKTINQNYGSSFQPITMDKPNFGGGAQGGGPASQSGAPTTPAAPASTNADPFSQFGGKKH